MTNRQRIGREWSRRAAFALLALMLPSLLAACSGAAPTAAPAPTGTASARGTTAAGPTGATGTGATGTGATIAAGTTVTTPASTTAPAASAAPTTAAATVAPVATVGVTTAVGTTATGAPAATAAMTTATGSDPRGMAPMKRGGGGTLHLLWWQAPTILNDHLAAGTNNFDASRIIEEPLAITSANATTPDIPVLAKSIPSTADGSVAADGKSVTWKLKDGVKWSDGTPFTAADVQATYQYVTRKESGASSFDQYAPVASVDTPDATTVKITFKEATALWYTPFTNIQGVVLQKAQLDACKDRMNCPVNSTPIGTGPYKVKSFAPGDNVQYVINENYREANAPFFDAIDLKGGGDATTAAKAVQTGNADYAWNLQVTPDILKQLTDSGKAVDLVGGGNGGVEQIFINFTDPNKDVDGEKSSVKAPHPFLTDIKVREAMSYLVDRDGIAKALYGPTAKPWCNVLLGTASVALQSKNTTCSFDVAKANQILEDAGYKKGPDGIRAKGSVRLQVTYATTVNAVREKEEQIIQQAFKQAGIQMDIKNADSSVFFGTPDNPDQHERFEKDLEMWTNGPEDPDARDYLVQFTTQQIPQKANGWSLNNDGRWSNAEYDALFATLDKELNPAKRAQIEVQLNDLIIKNFARIPIVDRSQAEGRRADLTNTTPVPWDSVLWNVAYWQLKK